MSRKDVYPLPRIDDILDTLGQTKFFSSLDLCSGYWQIEMHPDSRPKTAFVTVCTSLCDSLLDFVMAPQPFNG